MQTFYCRAGEDRDNMDDHNYPDNDVDDHINDHEDTMVMMVIMTPRLIEAARQLWREL